MRGIGLGIFVSGLVVGCGCSRDKAVSERDRKEAAHLVSEAEFAMTLRDWPRAEGLFAKATQLSPEGDYWLSLGAARLRMNNRGGAKNAYEAARKAFEQDAARRNGVAEPWVKQAYVLALLGRKDEGRALIAKAAKLYPNDVKLRALTDAKEFERMVSSPRFKEMAL